MTGPRELLRRAAANRRGVPVRHETPADFAQEVSAPRRDVVQSHHANYTALMQSHDRMRTRHLPGQAGEGRA